MITRTQIMRPRALLALAVVSALLIGLAGTAFADHPVVGGRPFSTTLTGAAEPNGGDPDGSGLATVTLNYGLAEVCFQISVSDIALPATGAHIHRAAAGVNGPVVVPLTPPDATGVSSGCKTGVDQALILDIIQNPDGYYVNVHSTQYPGGAVRGQLSK